MDLYGLDLELQADASCPPAQDAPSTQQLSNVGVAIAVFKGNCGCAFLFMPRAWRNAGYVLSALLFPVVFMLSTLCAVRLLRCRAKSSGSYGDLVEQSIGPTGRIAVNISIILLQSGVCSVFLVFIGQVLQSVFFLHVPLWRLILGLAVAQTPLVAIRKMSKLWVVSLLGSVLVVAGIFALIGIEVQQVSRQGIMWEDLQQVGSHALVAVGTACYMAEGIGLVIPTYDSSSNPEQFPLIYAAVMALILLLVSTVGVLGYVTFGRDVQAMVLQDFHGGVAPNAIRLALAIAMFCTFPLQLLPAVRLVEDVYFKPMSQPSFARKCQKTTFRATFVVGLAIIAIVGSTSLDNFVSLLGGLCGMPLAFVYPALCHYRLVAGDRPLDRLIDVGLVCVGLMVTAVVTVVNVAEWGSPAA